MTVDLFIEYNFAPIIGLFFQLVILVFGKTFNKKEKFIFYAALGLQILELLAYNLEFYFASLDHPTIWRTLFSVIGYVVRPALIYPFVYLMHPDVKGKWSKLIYLDLIPLLIVVFVQQFAFYTHWVFWFSDSNSFHRGPLGYISQIITVIYMVVAGAEVILRKALNKHFSVALIVVLLIYVVLAMLFESIFNIHSLGISAGVFSIVFFMFSLQTNRLNDLSSKLKTLSEVDSLSQLYNRYAGERAVDELMSRREKGAFIIMDIDKFKNINDTYGHSVGDEAIVKVAQALKETFNEKGVVMRLGGDEFAVYSLQDLNDEGQKQIVDALFARISNIRISSDENFRISISGGLVKYDGEEETSFDKLYKVADIKLYEAKKQKGNYICE